MSSEQNKAIVRRLLEEPWKGDLRVVDELIDRNYVGYDPSIPEPLRGPDGFKENVSTYRAAYSDARITVNDQIAEGDKVATRWIASATHTGSLQGMPPTGKAVRVTGVNVTRFAEGKIAESWSNFDMLTLLKQLGAIPTPEHGGK
jgi:steroid delta-isomerase-like uncharacterized protein